MSLLQGKGRAVITAACLAVAAGAWALMGQYGGAPIWWDTGSPDRMPLSATYQDKSGDLLVYNAEGDMATRGHAFFTPMGSNGRACITCHQLSNAMSVTPERLADRWEATGGTDPVFAAVDGSDCPTLPQDQRGSHALLLQRGLFRIYQPWPAANVTPEFTVEVVRDPTGCNSGAKYGLHAASPTISVYRRPRMVGNFKYLSAGQAFTADSRVTSLEAQAIDAVQKHEQGSGRLSAADMQQIIGYERQVYVAQSRDDAAGDLTEVGGPQGLGPWHLARGTAAGGRGSFLQVEHWAAERTSAGNDFRRSVERGSQVFSSRTLSLTQTANLQQAGSSAQQGTCTTCHSEAMTGAGSTQPWTDIGTSSLPWAGDDAALPLFKITCTATAEPHPYLGRVIYTNDPGRALVTGRCRDVGSLVTQQLRGLAARAPYFTGGSAKDLRAVVDFYDRRYNAHYTPQEKQDLVNFLSVL